MLVGALATPSGNVIPLLAAIYNKEAYATRRLGYGAGLIKEVLSMWKKFILLPGQSVTIPEGVRHWHGAAPGQMFQHIAVMEPVQGAWTEWFIPVDEQLFQSLS